MKMTKGTEDRKGPELKRDVPRTREYAFGGNCQRHCSRKARLSAAIESSRGQSPGCRIELLIASRCSQAGVLLLERGDAGTQGQRAKKRLVGLAGTRGPIERRQDLQLGAVEEIVDEVWRRC